MSSIKVCDEYTPLRQRRQRSLDTSLLKTNNDLLSEKEEEHCSNSNLKMTENTNRFIDDEDEASTSGNF